MKKHNFVHIKNFAVLIKSILIIIFTHYNQRCRKILIFRMECCRLERGWGEGMLPWKFEILHNKICILGNFGPIFRCKFLHHSCTINTFKIIKTELQSILQMKQLSGIQPWLQNVHPYKLWPLLYVYYAMLFLFVYIFNTCACVHTHGKIILKLLYSQYLNCVTLSISYSVARILLL